MLLQIQRMIGSSLQYNIITHKHLMKGNSQSKVGQVERKNHLSPPLKVHEAQLQLQHICTKENQVIFYLFILVLALV